MIIVVSIRWFLDESFHSQQNCFLLFIRIFAIGQPEHALSLSDADASSLTGAANAAADSTPSVSTHRLFERCTLLLTYALGIQVRFFDCLFLGILLLSSLELQVTLISMGFYQERIMTQGYARRDAASGIVERFHDSQFLVFANRVVALCLVGVYVAIKWRK